MSDDYGFQMDWEDDDKFDESEVDDDDQVSPDIELRATEILFDSISSYPGHEESIERFCIPLFQRVGSEYAINHVMIFFDDKPSMTQIYASYLAHFIEKKEISRFLSQELNDDSYSDWQAMWIIAALLQSFDVGAEVVRIAYTIAIDANRHEGLRAVAAIFVGKFGDFARRRSLINLYPTVSEFIKSAIYFSTMYWGAIGKRNARATWGAQGILNRLITQAFDAR